MILSSVKCHNISVLVLPPVNFHRPVLPLEGQWNYLTGRAPCIPLVMTVCVLLESELLPLVNVKKKRKIITKDRSLVILVVESENE